MTLRLNGSTSGYTEIDAPAAAGSNTLILPTSNGSAGNILGTDGSGNLSWVNGRMVLATAQNSTSGTAIDFTGIPSWVKRVTVMFNGVSTSGTSIKQVQLGTSSGATTSGYAAAYAVIATAANTTSTSLISTGFGVGLTSATDTIHGSFVFTNVTGNTWCGSGTLVNTTGGNATSTVAGTINLSGTLDRIRITTVNGTDTFDAGSINIMYEG